MSADDDQRPPLARLFAIAYRSLIDELQDALRDRGWHDVRPAYGFVLLAARSSPTTSTELAALLGTTKQASSKLVAAMESAGYVRRCASPTDARRRPVELTDRGLDLLRAAEAVYTDLEASWSDVIGADHVERMRTDLVTVLSCSGGGLPAVRPP